MNIKERLDNVTDLLSSTTTELEGIGTFAQDIEDQFYRRLFLRNTFSMIDTYIYLTDEIVKIVLEIDETKAKLVLWPELVILNRTTVLLDDKGKIKLKDNFQKFEPSLRFSLNLFSKVFQLPEPDYGDRSFQKLIQLYKKRNQVTHPKSIDELLITEQEVEDIMSMFSWFTTTHHNIGEHFTEWLKTKYYHFH